MNSSRIMLEQRISDNDASKRDIPSFIEPRPPLIAHPFMRPRPQKGTNLMELFEEDSEIDEPELVQVYLRMKPCDVKSNLYEVRSNKCLLTSLDTTTAGHGRRTQHNVSRMYTFSKIFGPQGTQKEIFETVVKENLKKLVNGNSFTLLTYGASGSGKTYTLMGTVNAPGLIPRSLEYVFKLVDAAQTPLFKPSDTGADRLGHEHQEYELQWVKRLRHVSAPLKDRYRRMSAQLHSDLTDSNFDISNRTKYYVWVSFLEIYNEAIYDLLASPDKRTKLRIREDSSGNVYVKDATQAFVRSGEEAYDVMAAGKHNLVVAATGVHAHSSRSHCIFTITMLTECDGEIRTSCVRLCDLAGCERARATRNTGTRMAESRAINSSLHVLERCLHTLRKKQKCSAALVPYRESKLTRLLGSGLSGSRGEAVSMVVTLNPAPQYAQETKHVLSLAAVAQDIQINQTIFASTLESNETQDATIGSSDEVMKLRADYELLHYELIQTQSRNKALLAAMEEKQEETANTMRELVEEAKDMTKQFYEREIKALRSEMDDMIEEYEARLSKCAAAPPPAATPTRYLQAKIAKLMTKVAVLEDKLAEERLARDRAEKELEHLRNCLDERDEKDAEENKEVEIVLTDSEDEASDPFNESLEPVFKKTHLHNKKTNENRNDESKCDGDTSKCDDETSKCDDETSKCDDEISKCDDEISKCDDETSKCDDETSKYDDVSDISGRKDDESGNISLVSDTERINVNKNVNNSNVNRYIFDNNTHVSVQFGETVNSSHENCQKVNETDNNSHGTEGDNSSDTVKFEDCDTTPKNSTYNADDEYEISHKNITQDFTNKNNEINTSDNIITIDNIESKDKSDPAVELNETKNNDSMNESKQRIARGTYFVKDSLNLYTKSNDSIDSDKDNLVEEFSVNTDSKTDSQFDENTIRKVEAKIDKSYASKAEVKFDTKTEVTKPKISLVSKILHSLTNQDSNDTSLRQFEQLEVASKVCRNNSDDNVNLSDMKIVIENKIYFEDSTKKSDDDCCMNISDSDCIIKKALEKTLNENKNIKPTLRRQENLKCPNDETNLLPVSILTEKRTYFDNIDPIPSKILAELQSEVKNNERSPSIVKDDIDNNYEPVTIKKRIRESFKTDVLVQKNNKKHDSIDLFESPHLTVKTPKKFNIDELTTKLQRQNEEYEMTAKNKEHDKNDVLSKVQNENNNKHISTTIIEQQVQHINELASKNQNQDVSKLQTEKSVVIPKIATDEEEIDPLVKRLKDLTKIDDIGKSIEKFVLKQKTLSEKQDKSNVNIEAKSAKLDKIESGSSVEIIEEKTAQPIVIQSIDQTFNETQNTDAEFENIYNRLSKQRATEFDLLVSSEINDSKAKGDFKEPNKVNDINVTNENEEKNIMSNKNEEAKYNLRRKGPKSVLNTSDDNKKPKVGFIEEFLAHGSKTDTKNPMSKRSLRLKRRKNLDEDHNSEPDQDTKSDQSKDKSDKFDNKSNQLKNLVNLKNEFADVTMGLPAMKKEVNDIPSPEKRSDEEENQPPLMGIQSCPSKSVTRSRRKLFTPRAEPLEESLTQTGDSNERVYVPRPSYHRGRARRKL